MFAPTSIADPFLKDIFFDFIQEKKVSSSLFSYKPSMLMIFEISSNENVTNRGYFFKCLNFL